MARKVFVPGSLHQPGAVINLDTSNVRFHLKQHIP